VQLKVWLGAVLLAAQVFLLAGCGTMAGLGVAKAVATPEQQVMKRAQARWDALIARNLDLAYTFITPAGRSTMPVDTYRGRVNPQFWRKVAVAGAKCEADVCDVNLNIEFTVLEMPLSNAVSEKWILVDGEWYFIYRG
jgi:hypothetical protein